jgi:hypothetical protein
MGKGNINLSLPLRGGFFLDHEHFNVYLDSAHEEIDGDATQIYFEDFVHDFQELFSKKHVEFKPMYDSNKILTSHLFDIIIEDNEWSQAILFEPCRFSPITGVELFYNVYLESMKNILLDMFDYLHTYAGPWTTGIIRKEVKE